MNAPDFHPAYMETRFSLEDEDQGDELLADVDEGSWAILTAFATTGEQWAEEENEQADRSLYADLKAGGITQIYRITGYSPSRNGTRLGIRGGGFHPPRLEGSALGKRRHVLAVAKKFKQDALYLVADASLFLHGCTAREKRLPLSLGFFRDRLDVSEEAGGRG